MSDMKQSLDAAMDRRLTATGDRAMAHYGLIHQIMKLGEEAAELSRAVIRQVNYPKNKEATENLKEEIIDVMIVTHQILPLLMTMHEYHSRLTSKLDRLDARIEKEKGQ